MKVLCSIDILMLGLYVSEWISFEEPVDNHYSRQKGTGKEGKNRKERTEEVRMTLLKYKEKSNPKLEFGAWAPPWGLH